MNLNPDTRVVVFCYAGQSGAARAVGIFFLNLFLDAGLVWWILLSPYEC